MKHNDNSTHLSQYNHNQNFFYNNINNNNANYYILLLYCYIPHIKLCNGFRTLEIWCTKTLLFYVFVAFVGLKSNTILAMQNIEFGSVSSDRYPDPTEMPISKQYQS